MKQVYLNITVNTCLCQNFLEKMFDKEMQWEVVCNSSERCGLIRTTYLTSHFIPVVRKVQKCVATSLNFIILTIPAVLAERRT
jgi:hypothetical protein